MQTDQGFELIDINDKEADFDIEKWLNGNFRLSNDYIKQIRASRLKMTTEPLTFYVRTDGNDNNDGSTNDSAHALRTITKAIELATIARYVAHAVKIRVTAGDYSTEGPLSGQGVVGYGSFTIVAFDGTNDIGVNTLTSSYKIHSINLFKCKSTIIVQALEATATTHNAFVADNSEFVWFSNCSTTSASPYAGFVYTNGAKGATHACIASNKVQALYADLSSIVQSRSWGACSGNTYGLYTVSSNIYKFDTQPQGTTAEYETGGGLILGNGVTQWNGCKKYNTLVELGLNSASCTYSDIANAMKPNSMLICRVPNSNFVPEPYKYELIVRKYEFGISDFDMNEIYNSANGTPQSRYIARFYNDGTVTRWSGFNKLSISAQPTRNRIVTGFANGWSGTLDWRVNQEGKKSYRLNLLNSVDIVAGITTVYSGLPVEARPSEDVMITINLFGVGQNSIAGSFVNIIISTFGTVLVYPVLNTYLTGARMIYGATLSEY